MNCLYFPEAGGLKGLSKIFSELSVQKIDRGGIIWLKRYVSDISAFLQRTRRLFQTYRAGGK